MVRYSGSACPGRQVPEVGALLFMTQLGKGGGEGRKRRAIGEGGGSWSTHITHCKCNQSVQHEVASEKKHNGEAGK